MTLGELIKQYRTEEKMSMDDFAERSGLSKGYISMLEKNQNPQTGQPISPSLQTIKNVSNGMNMDFEKVISMIDQNSQIKDTPPNSAPKSSSSEDVNERILNLMKANNISYANLAEKTGCSKSALQRYFTGNTQKVPIDVIEKIALALNVTATYLAGWEEQGPMFNNSTLETSPVTPKESNIIQDELYRIFSENLLYYMKKNGDKQVDIANLLGITRGIVSQYCSGKAIPRIKKIDILAKHFGIDRSDLLDKRKNTPDIFNYPCIIPIELKEIINMRIGERIRNLRIERNVTQTELASKIHVTKQTMYKYEQGIVTNIPYNKIELLAKSLHTTPAYLIGWEEKDHIFNAPRILPAEKKKIPLPGSIACEEPIFYKEFESYAEVNTDVKKIFSKNLTRYMKEEGITQKEIAKIAGVSAPTVNNWIKCHKYPRIDRIEKIAMHFGIRKSDLIEDNANEKYKDYSVFNASRVLPIEKRKIPLLGGVTCGKPIFCEEFESYVDVNTDVKADFALKAADDSMVNIGIKDGYIVFIRQQPAVDNGEVAAVNIDGEFTLKRVYNYGNILVLRAENPDFPDMEYREGDADNIVILGKAVAFQGDVR